jgi:aryl-alcohol dehydrogenase-like predicted oxidoreductase
MKKHLIFPESSPTTSLGYGTTSLMGVPTSVERRALLDVAFDAGIRHFDTAPYYGYGEAERVLGEFIADKRDQLTITTKFGIQAPAMVKHRLVNLMARQVLRLVPSLRKSLSKKAQSLSKRGAFSPDAARRSLDQSLKSLKTDHVDLFLLHEPTLADASSEEIHTFLEEEVRRGRIRSYGCGGEFSAIQAIAEAHPPTSGWLQFEDHVLSRRIESVRPLGSRCITYRTFQRALPFLSDWLAANPAVQSEWESQLDLSLQEMGALSGLLLAASLARNPEGVVLFSSGRSSRIRDAALVAEGRFSQDQIQRFSEMAQTVPSAVETAA